MQLASGREPSGIQVRLDDGRIWDGFETEFASECWRKLFAGKPRTLATAKDVWEMSVSGSEIYLIAPTALEFGLHPFTEVHDILIEHDNGRVPFELARGPRSYDPETAVFIPDAEWGNRQRSLPSTIPAPASIDVQSAISGAMDARNGGEIILFDAEVKGCTLKAVGWRPDRRRTKGVLLLSLHGIESCAIANAREEAKLFVPPPRIKSSKIRDYQKSAVYAWENSFPKENRWFGSIEECREVGEDICSDLGIKAPAISLGPPSLKNYSYYNRWKGIVFARDMLSMGTLVHEMAHHVVQEEQPRLREATHGPVFVGTLAGMLARYCGADIEEVLAKADAAGLHLDRDRAIEIAERFSSGLKIR